jgi:hypothetical protein
MVSIMIMIRITLNIELIAWLRPAEGTLAMVSNVFGHPRQGIAEGWVSK